MTGGLPLLLAVIAVAEAPADAPGKPPLPAGVLGTPPIRLLRETVEIFDGETAAITPAQHGGEGAVVNLVRYRASFQLKNLSAQQLKLSLDVPTLTDASPANVHFGAYRRFSMEIRGQTTATPQLPPPVRVRIYPRSDLWQLGLRDQTLFALEQRRWLRWIDDEHLLVDLVRLGDKPNAVRSALAKLTELDDGQRLRLELLAKDQRSERRQRGLDVTYTSQPLPVTFGPGQTLTVEIEATSARGIEGARSYSFAYLRALGARWHGTVGSSEVVLHPAADRAIEHYRLFPPDYRIMPEGEIRWLLQNQEPTENIVVVVRPASER